MTLIVDYVTERGNTVPYPPLFDDVRRNHGFVDLRGRPDLVEAIPEVSDSLALRDLLFFLANKDSGMMSVVCDLGSHRRKSDSLMPKHRSGGYIQFTLNPLSESNLETLRSIALSIEFCLRDRLINDIWIVKFALCRTKFNFDRILETNTLWIWFDAAAVTPEKARLSRERLISSLTEGVRRYDTEKFGELNL